MKNKSLLSLGGFLSELLMRRCNGKRRSSRVFRNPRTQPRVGPHGEGPGRGPRVLLVQITFGGCRFIVCSSEMLVCMISEAWSVRVPRFRGSLVRGKRGERENWGKGGRQGRRERQSKLQGETQPGVRRGGARAGCVEGESEEAGKEAGQAGALVSASSSALCPA